MMQFAHSIEILATALFVLAVLHTFATSFFQRLASRFPEGSLAENCFHLLGEVEIVFGFWGGILIVTMAIFAGRNDAVHYAEGLSFTEPLFVFAIMVVAATKPIIEAARSLILGIARLLPLPREIAVYGTCLVLGPLLGSLITEPAAMTVTALLLRERYFSRISSPGFQYVTLATLFVNVSIGGVLTHFAAPPVLMVAGKWDWDTPFMLSTFGWKAAIAVLLNAMLAVIWVKRYLGQEAAECPPPNAHVARSVPALLIGIHLLFLVMIVATAHHAVIFIGIFLFFLGVATITKEYQDRLEVRQALLVAFFLGGLVVLGGLQRWWIDPLLRQFDALPLFLGAAALTAITDNAALTYLGSQVEGTSELFKYALVGGAVAGGGLTVIANAPNPAGFSILQSSFGTAGISPLRLALAALVPTAVALTCFWVL